MRSFLTSIVLPEKCYGQLPNTKAAQVIVDTNEFKNIKEGKEYACPSGVAPF